MDVKHHVYLLQSEDGEKSIPRATGSISSVPCMYIRMTELLLFNCLLYGSIETDKVLFTVEERAKAYLSTTSPIVNDVCEVPYDSSLSYKQMQVPTASAAFDP